MPERIVVDSARLGVLADTLTRSAGELAGVAIPGVAELPGSALGGLAAPARVAAEVHRLGTALQDWVCSVRRSVNELDASDGATAQRLQLR
ncbi:hypothetical protein [Mycolicibacterium aichiense]|uniref:Uncharacterized protein n=1 Tax=Mycolicibacterium aichiense TaxID=1799 RepID=A0AAD1MCF9_9MYCO|nr:hypothetical protein [Mycolicibacterium aichiense]MCV7020160.1 hypothetical protein [Mycolicibacterium aichiense]BBX07756.1 hypothetical protein MAIC_25590 [Mycolicibacterium aichiense]STZ81568.1 Uncharacterised protein [Mycolicibacterium aichiense]